MLLAEDILCKMVIRCLVYWFNFSYFKLNKLRIRIKVLGHMASYSVIPLSFVFTGQLLFPTQNIMAFILLCISCCIYPSIHQSIWKWSSGDVLYRVQWTMVSTGVNSLYVDRSSRGKYLIKVVFVLRVV